MAGWKSNPIDLTQRFKTPNPKKLKRVKKEVLSIDLTNEEATTVPKENENPDRASPALDVSSDCDFTPKSIQNARKRKQTWKIKALKGNEQKYNKAGKSRNKNKKSGVSAKSASSSTRKNKTYVLLCANETIPKKKYAESRKECVSAVGGAGIASSSTSQAPQSCSSSPLSTISPISPSDTDHDEEEIQKRTDTIQTDVMVSDGKIKKEGGKRAKRVNCIAATTTARKRKMVEWKRKRSDPTNKVKQQNSCSNSSSSSSSYSSSSNVSSPSLLYKKEGPLTSQFQSLEPFCKWVRQLVEHYDLIPNTDCTIDVPWRNYSREDRLYLGENMLRKMLLLPPTVVKSRGTTSTNVASTFPSSASSSSSYAKHSGGNQRIPKPGPDGIGPRLNVFYALDTKYGTIELFNIRHSHYWSNLKQYLPAVINLNNYLAWMVHNFRDIVQEGHYRIIMFPAWKQKIAQISCGTKMKRKKK
eukprot:jgi/Bigna1/71201/fgenesh1_pg.14_\